MSLYRKLTAIGAKIDHHRSDLYVLLTPEVFVAIKAAKVRWTVFLSQIDGEIWADVPFEYEPFWDRAFVRGHEAARRELASR